MRTSTHILQTWYTISYFFFFNDTATTEIYTLSLHDALPIWTAQKAVRGIYSPDKFVASFAGYVPADRPRLAILVVVDEPKVSQYGGTVAAPVFKEIAESTLRYLRVAPSIPVRTIPLGAPLLAAFSQEQRPA